jgi:hypothetical protein
MFNWTITRALLRDCVGVRQSSKAEKKRESGCDRNYMKVKQRSPEMGGPQVAIHEEIEREGIKEGIPENERDRARSCAFFQIFEILVVFILESGAWF